MAKKTFFQKIKEFFTGGGKSSSGKSSSNVKKASGSYYGGGYSSSYRARSNEEDEKEKLRQQLAEQNKQTTAKLAAIAKVSQRTDALSSGKKSLPPEPKELANNGVERAVRKIGEKSKAAPDPKQAAAKKSQENAKKRLESIKAERAEFHERTGHKYDPEVIGKKQAAQLVKGGFDTADPVAEQMAVEYHPIAYSAARGGLSGVTLGASELAIKAQAKRDEERAKNEKYYQEHKNKAAEFAGEMAGSLATFGLTGGASKEAVAKAAPKLMQGVESTATRKLLNSRLIRRAAEKEAIKRFGIEGATKEVIEEIVKRRAATAAAEIGKDTAINLTTGAASDIMHSIKDSENVGDFVKQMGVNAGLNVLLGGATSVVPQFRVGRVADDVVENALRQNADDAARRIVEFPNAEQSGIDVINPNIRNADEAVEGAVRNVDEARVEPPSLNEVETAPPKLEDVETAPPPLNEATQGARRNVDDVVSRVKQTNEELGNRLEELQREFAEVDVRAKQGDPDAIARRGEIQEEVQSIINDLGAKPRRVAPPELKAEPERVEPPRASTGNDRTADELITAIEDFDGEALALEQQIRNESGDTRRELERRLREHKQKNGLDNYVLTPAERESLLQRKNELLEYNKTHPEEIYTANRWENSDKIDVINRLLSVEDNAASAPKTQLKAELDSVQKELDELPFTEENFGRREELTKRRAEIDELLKGSDIVDDSVRPTGAAAQNEVNKDIQKAAKKGGTEWGNGENYEGYSVKEVQEMRAAEKTEGEIRTKRGAVTIATGMGDAHFATGMRESLESGEFDRNVRHNIQEYDKGVKRFVKYIEGKGGKDGKESISDLITRFNNFAKSNKPMTSNEMRDQLYDILVAVDWANANKDNPLSEQLFLAATRAGAEQSSVGGLTLYQWHRIAMSSPEHRAKVVKEQIENMFNSSRKFRKKYLGSVKKKLGDKFSAVGDDLPLDKFMEENPEVSKGMKAAYERLEKATSKDEVETAASEFLLEARKVMPVTAFDQLTQWRYVAMLSSPKTHIKNIVGNLYSGTLGQMSVAMSSSMENRLAKELELTTTKNVDLSKGVAADQDLYLKSASGLSRTARNNAKKGVFAGIELRNAKSKLKEAERKLAIAEKGADTTELKKQVKELTEKVAKAQKNFDAKKIKAEDDLLGAKAQDLYHNKSVEQLIQDATKWEKQTYGAVSGGLEKASNFIGGALETSDAVAVERIYRETAEKILKANDYERFVKLAAGEGKEAAAAKAICDRIEEYAAEHAAYRAALDTYRNYNAVATWMNKVVKNTLYNADAKWYKKAGGFALHAVMPFTKVPTNIMKRSFDYSPAGLIQGKKMLDAAIESGNYAEINKAVERLAEGTIGTGIASLGMAMGMLDPDGMVVTTRLNRNDERDKAKKDRGYMDYSVKLGNRDYTLEWATPTASDFFVGVETGRMLNNIYQKFADGNGLDFDPSKALEASGEILTRLVEPTLQLGMFQGVNSILEDSMEQRYEEANINPLFKAVGAITKNYVSSMTPSVVRSLSKAFAKSDYYISGKNDLDYRKNLLISKIPGLSAQMLDAKTNAWGEIKNERSDPKERVLRGAETLLAPWNSSEITWDDTDTKLYDFAEEYKKTHPKVQTLDFLPKVFYDYNNEGLTFGKNADTATHVELSNNDAAQYNIARGKAGEDAMAAALESVIFNRWYKDEKGHLTVADPKNYTPAMKAAKIAEFKDKGMKDVVAWVMDQQAFKDATPAEQAQIIREVIGNSGKDTSIGAKRTSELAVAKRHDISEEEYNYKNEVTANAQKVLDDAIAAGIVTYEEATDFARNAGKTYYRTDQKGEDGGSVQTYYNKKEMMEYLASKGYDYEKAEALYNAFKSANLKDFNGIDTSSGRGRRGYGGYRRRGGGSSKKAKVPAPKKIAQGSLKSGEALVSKKKSSSSRSNSKTTLARVEAKIDLPTAKYSKQKRG